MPARYGKNKVIRSGQYRRMEWPDVGGVMQQSNLVVEIFALIRDEETKMLSEKAR